MRDVSIDICKGVAILAMIAGHCGFPYMPFIDSFHMPLFFIFAGYFYRQRSVRESLTKDFCRLIVPYIVFASIYVIKFTITKGYKGDWDTVLTCLLNAFWTGGPLNETDVIFSCFHGIGAIWFLPALFWCKNVYNVVDRNVSNIGSKFVLCLLLSLLAIYTFNYIIIFPFSILTGCSSLFFFAVGHYARNYEISISISGILILLWIVAILFSDMSIAVGIFNCVPLNFLGACGGTFAVYKFSQFVEKHLPLFKNALSWCGRYSMVILCFHFLNSILDISNRFGIYNWILLFVIQLIIIIPLVMVSCRLAFTKRLFQI